MLDENLSRLTEDLKSKQAKMSKVLDQAEAGGKGLNFGQVTELQGSDQDKAAQFRKINDDCSASMKAVEDYRETLKAADEARKRNEIVNRLPMPQSKGKEQSEKQEYKSFADKFMEAGCHLKENKGKEITLGDVEIKTLMDEVTNGWVPFIPRTGRLVDKAVRPIQVIDLIPGGFTDSIAIKYMEETTLTDGATEVNEAGTYPEAAMIYTERTENVRKIGVFLPVTDEQLEDVSQVRGLINNRLPAAIMRRLDSQLVNGSGTGSPAQLNGMLAHSGTQSYNQASASGDLPVDALRRSITLIHTQAFSIPNGVLLHPNDWENIRLMKTVQGAYIWGHPAEMGIDRIWGLPVAQCDSLTQFTAIVADFQQSELDQKRGIEILTSNSHDVFFTAGKQAVRASGRWAFVMYRPAAFVKVTLTP